MQITIRLALFLVAMALVACAPQRKIKKSIEQISLFDEAFTGYQIIDLQSGKTIASRHADKYFRPGSTTKLFTFFTCLKILPDSLIAYRSYDLNDSMQIIQGMADPTTLHPDFQAWHRRHLPQQSKAKKNYIDFSNWQEKPWAPGWMWDDLDLAFSCERSALAVHGNFVQIHKSGTDWAVKPPYSGFEVLRNQPVSVPLRQIPDALLLLPPVTDSLRDTFTLPMLDANLVAMTNLGLLPFMPPYGFKPVWKNHFGTPRDTALRYMMQESDNFFAEQLLLQCAAILTDTLRADGAIKHAQSTWFRDYPTPPVWVDGSGVTHYNLITPESLVRLLQSLWQTENHERLLGLLAAGGVSGTIKDWYKGPEGMPYVFAKTGTLRSVHSLSGYLRTKKGKWLAFSFMHNNYKGSSAKYKKEMQSVLEKIHESL